MKKIGILTFHNAINYGAVLQAFALKNTVKKLECDCKIINYRNVTIENNDSYSMKDFIKPKQLLKIISQFQGTTKKKKEFAVFSKKHLEISSTEILKSDLKNLTNQYDMFIVGSDQVWNPVLTHDDYTYFLDFCTDNTKKCSYAASFGELTLSKSQEEKCLEYLSEFSYISIREQNKVNEYAKKINKKLYCHIDPVFLLSKDEWRDMTILPQIKSDYILVYYIHKSSTLINYAKQLSKQTGLKVYIINQNLFKSYPSFKYLRGLGPEKFLGYFYNAKYIVTNSFHGTAFSIIFNKKFKSELDKDGKTNNRIYSLLSLFDLLDRTIESNLSIDDDINYDKSNKIINQLIQSSKQYLEDCIYTKE